MKNYNICSAQKIKIMKTLINLLFLISLFSFSQPSDLGYELNGSNDYILVPNTTNINSSNTAVANRTIETWFKTTDSDEKQVIYEEGGGVNAILIYLKAGRLYCGAYKTNGSSAEFFRSEEDSILNDTWYHVTFVISTSGDNTTFKWYLNGILQDSQSGFAIPKHTGDINLGRNGNLRYANCSSWETSSVENSTSENCSNNSTSSSTTKYYYSGNIWGFRIWNVERTSEQINENINNDITSGDNLVAYLDDDSIKYLNSSNEWVSNTANGNSTVYNWSANANSTDWDHPGNWHGSNVPSTTKLQKVVIPASDNYPTITSEFKIGKLELSSPDSQLIVEDGGILNVYYEVENSGTITIKNNGSFILQDDEEVSGSGTFIVERDTPDYPADYYSIWSTPVQEEDSELGDIFTNTIIAYEYDASQNPSSYVQLGMNHNMEVGKGYFVRSDNDSGILQRTFTGSINNGKIESPVYYNSNVDNFNLIGNPYTSALNWLSFLEDNSDVLDGTVYFWSQSQTGSNNSAADYISFNATGSSHPGEDGKIATGQGFFVKTLQPGTVTFKNSQRVVENSQFYKAESNSDEGKSWFRLSGSMGYSPILIGFIPGATDNYETTYDGQFINEGASIEFYSFIDQEDSTKLDIQGRSELQENQFIQVPLGYQVLTAGDYTISRVQDYIDPSFNILLEDTLENTMTDLRVSDYTFNVSNPTEDNNRFILHYNYAPTLNVEEFSNTSNNLTSFFSNNELITKASKELNPVSLSLFDLSGKEIFNANYSESISINNLSSGVYIVSYIMENSSPITKKIIKG